MVLRGCKQMNADRNEGLDTISVSLHSFVTLHHVLLFSDGHGGWSPEQEQQ